MVICEGLRRLDLAQRFVLVGESPRFKRCDLVQGFVLIRQGSLRRHACGRVSYARIWRSQKCDQPLDPLSVGADLRATCLLHVIGAFGACQRPRTDALKSGDKMVATARRSAMLRDKARAIRTDGMGRMQALDRKIVRIECRTARNSQ